MRLGPGVTLLPFTHPVRHAERWAAVDILTDGRLEMGVGRGVTPKEFNTFRPGQFANPRTDTRDLFFECLEIIRRCWTWDEVTFEGRYYQITDPITVVPKPVQKPMPQFWVAAGSPDSFELYPQYDLKLLATTAVHPLYDLEENVARYKRKCAELGKPEGWAEIGCLVPAHCAPTTAQAVAEMKEPELWYFAKLREFFSPPRAVVEKTAEAGGRVPYHWWETPDWDYIYDNRMVICGDPDECIRQIESFVDVGITRIMAQFQVGGMPHDKVMRALALWGEHVIPHFQKQGARAGAR
jgi:alkanesulfonate monooxygenase SsuD/methylene tetrahydromethanopterin reductase-like flavin-dependent oxidoreductase (luciferase family)